CLRHLAPARLRGPIDAVPLRRAHARQRELARRVVRRAQPAGHLELQARHHDRALAAGHPHRLALAGAVVAAMMRPVRNARGLTLTEVAVVMILGTMIMA